MSIEKNRTDAYEVLNTLWSLSDEELECERRANVLSACVLLSDEAREDAKKLRAEISNNALENAKKVQRELSKCKEAEDMLPVIEQRQQYINDLKTKLHVLEFSF